MATPRRSRLQTVLQLYGSPAAARSALRKIARVLRQRGPSGLLQTVRAKLAQPTRPIDAPQAAGPGLAFEDRWVLAGHRLSTRYGVSVIILTHGNLDLLATLLHSLSRSLDPGARVEVIVVNNGPPFTAPPVLGRQPTLLLESRPFSWSAYNNRAAAVATGDFLLFLNDDVEAIHGGWLDVMLAGALTPGTGAVGAKLLYPDGRVQHCGVAVRPDGHTEHIHRLAPREHPDGDRPCRGPRAVAAVTGACLLTSRPAFERSRGFDERLAYSYNDIAYCLQLAREARLQSVVADVELLHRESATRPIHVDRTEQRVFLSHVQAWQGALHA